MTVQLFQIYAVTAAMDLSVFFVLVSKEFNKRNCFCWIIGPVIVLYEIFNGLVPIFFGFEQNAIMNILLDVLIIFALFRGSTVKRIVYCILYLFIMCISEVVLVASYMVVSGTTFDNLQDNIYQWFLVMTVSEIIKLILVRIWNQKFGKNRHRIEGKSFYLLIIFPIVSVFLSFELLSFSSSTTPEMNRRICIMVILLFLADGIVFYIVDRMSMLLEKQTEYELFRQKSDLEQKYYNRLDEKARNQIVYQHDMKHYLASLAGLVFVDDNREAEVLFEEMQVQLQEITPKVYTRSGILNALLCEKEAEAIRRGVLFSIQVEPDVDLSFVKEIEMISMFGNLIDNAIQAAGDCKEQKEVSLNLFEAEGNFLVFFIKNSFLKNPVKVEDKFLTTKMEKKKHGYGIESVKSIAGRYGGILDLEIEGKYFVATLSLSKKWTI